MNKNLHQPKFKPYFPTDTRIFGKNPYCKFLKNRPKHLQKLTIERYDNIDDNIKSRRAMGIHIKRLTKSTKSIRNLDFIEFPHKEIPFNVGQAIMKRFTRIKRISLPGPSSNKKLCLLSYLYLKKLKGLRSLVLDEDDVGAFSFSEPPNLDRINSKFFRFLQKVKLEKLEHKVKGKNAPYNKILDFPHAPSSIKSWTFSCPENCLEKLKEMNNVNFMLNLNQLKNLKKLQMLTSLSLYLLNQVLGTIPQPENLKALAFQVVTPEEIIVDLLLTRALLTTFQGLEHLAVSFENWLDTLPLNCWKLKGLSIEIKTASKDSLNNIKKFISQQQASLESLDLKLRFEEEPEIFLEEIYGLIEEIGCLKKLKTLRICFVTKPKGGDDGWFMSQLKMGEKEINPLLILPLLINVINDLKNLKELGLYYIGASFEKDFEVFFQALLERSQMLETLEVNLAGYKIQERDLKVLMKILPQLKALEKLRLGNFVINDPSFFKDFAETIHICCNLNDFELSDVKVGLPEYNPEEMLDMLKKIFQKKNLTHIRFRDGSGDFKAYDSCEKLRLNQLYEECPHIQTLIVPIQTYHFEFPSKWRGI